MLMKSFGWYFDLAPDLYVIGKESFSITILVFLFKVTTKRFLKT